LTTFYLTIHGIEYFSELVFDTYVNGEKLEKRLWEAKNWTYHETDRWSGEYRMMITNELLWGIE
jgi:hypothetical protein